MSDCVCGTLFSDEPFGPKDRHGCHLPLGHSGPHEFVALGGAKYHWETDWDCDCDSCRSDDGDMCFVYWQAP